MESYANLQIDQNEILQAIAESTQDLKVYDEAVGPSNVRTIDAQHSLGRADAKQ